MVSGIIKVAGNTVAVNTTNTAVSYKLVRILNTDTVPTLITVFDTVSNTQVGTFQIAPNADIVLEKRVTDVLTCNNATKAFANPIGFKN